MQFSMVVLVAALSSTAFAAPAVRNVLEARGKPCNCDEANQCMSQCSAFDVGMGGGLSQGMCILNCEPAAHCKLDSCSGGGASGGDPKGKKPKTPKTPKGGKPAGRAGGGRG